MGGVILLALLFVDPGRSVGQVAEVIWEGNHSVHELPPGRDWTRVPGALPSDANYYDYVDQSSSVFRTNAESLIDWLNCVVKLYVGGVHVGYVASGYAFPTNWMYRVDDCTQALPVEWNVAPQTGFLWETYDKWSAFYQMLTVARFDLQGNMVWHRAYHSGQSFGLIQDSEGNIVVTGEIRDGKPVTSPNGATAPWANVPIFMDPTTTTQTDMATVVCTSAQKLLVVDKIDPDGNLLWSHTFTAPSNTFPGPNARSLRTFGKSIVETHINGQLGYRVVGYANVNVSDPSTPLYKGRPFVVDMDGNGLFNWKKVFTDFASTGDGDAWYIARHPDPAMERYVVCGTGRRTGSPNQSVWLMYFNENDAQNPAWVKDTYTDNALFPGVDITRPQLATRVTFAVNGPTTGIVWPVLTNFYGGTSGSLDHEATGKLFRFGLNGVPDPNWTIPGLGMMRGYEIHLSAIQTQDGSIAVASTKRPGPWSLSNPFTWPNVDPAVKNCLVGAGRSPNVSDGYWDFDRDGTGTTFVAFDWAGYLSSSLNTGNWLSESYVAKLDALTGALQWQFQWSEDIPIDPNEFCALGNLRGRQCSFMLTEDPDGGLVVCGNSGHTGDDGYLAKIKYTCENKASLYTAFHALYPYNQSNVYTLPPPTPPGAPA